MKTTVLIMLSLFAFASCGKNNKVDPNKVGINTPGLSPVLNATQNTQIAQIKAQFPCGGNAGNARVDYNFQLVGATSATSIGGTLQPGLPGGVSSTVFVGVSYWKDLVVVSKVNTGAFAVTFSMCPYKNTNTGQDIIGGQAQLTQFQLDGQGIVLDYNPNCSNGPGNVDYARLAFRSSGYSLGYVDTLFAPYCTGQQTGYYH